LNSRKSKRHSGYIQSDDFAPLANVPFPRLQCAVLKKSNREHISGKSKPPRPPSRSKKARRCQWRFETAQNGVLDFTVSLVSVLCGHWGYIGGDARVRALLMPALSRMMYRRTIRCGSSMRSSTTSIRRTQVIVLYAAALAAIAWKSGRGESALGRSAKLVLYRTKTGYPVEDFAHGSPDVLPSRHHPGRRKPGFVHLVRTQVFRREHSSRKTRPISKSVAR
jgi:hypothetical protein